MYGMYGTCIDVMLLCWDMYVLNALMQVAKKPAKCLYTRNDFTLNMTFYCW